MEVIINFSEFRSIRKISEMKRYEKVWLWNLMQNTVTSDRTKWCGSENGKIITLQKTWDTNRIKARVRSWLWTERHHSERTGSYLYAKYINNNLCTVCTKSADCAAKVSHSHTININIPFSQESWTMGKWIHRKISKGWNSLVLRPQDGGRLKHS